MVVKHFDSTGKPGSAFGNDGGTTFPGADASTADRGRSLLRQSDGRFSVAGSSFGTASGPYGIDGPLAVGRLTKTGLPDPSFGGGVLTTTKLMFSPFYMTHVLGHLCDGTVLVAGRLDVAPGNQDLAVLKLDPFGAPLLAFGSSGIATLPLLGNQSPIGAAKDPTTGKVVVIGGTQTPGQLVAARFNP
ncbi:hypothetical protein BH09MYX1_BH09MYX1_61420 [soil metagenome]